MHSLRILGHCPHCEALDTIFGTGEGIAVSCIVCEAIWDQAFILIGRERRQGRKLILVKIHTGSPRIAMVEYPVYKDIPCAREITLFLRACLLVKFQLRHNFHTDGAAWGTIEGEAIDLRDREGHYICLTDGEPGRAKAPQTEAILLWCTMLLEILFARPFTVADNDGNTYELRCGQILWLNPDAPDYPRRVDALLWLALRAYDNDPGFADDVLRQMDTIDPVPPVDSRTERFEINTAYNLVRGNTGA